MSYINIGLAIGLGLHVRAIDMDTYGIFGLDDFARDIGLLRSGRHGRKVELGCSTASFSSQCGFVKR